MRSQTVREERFENALKIFENICVLKPFVKNGLRTVEERFTNDSILSLINPFARNGNNVRKPFANHTRVRSERFLHW